MPTLRETVEGAGEDWNDFVQQNLGELLDGLLSGNMAEVSQAVHGSAPDVPIEDIEAEAPVRSSKVFIRQTEDLATDDIQLRILPGMEVKISKGQIWGFRYAVTLSVSHQNADLRVQVDGPGKGRYFINNIENAVSKTQDVGVQSTNIAVATATNGNADTHIVEGWIEAEEDGVLSLSVRNNAAGNEQVFSQSWMTAEQLSGPTETTEEPTGELQPTLPNVADWPIFNFQDQFQNEFRLQFQNNTRESKPVEVFVQGVPYESIGFEEELKLQSEKLSDGTYSHLIQWPEPLDAFESVRLTGKIEVMGEGDESKLSLHTN